MASVETSSTDGVITKQLLKSKSGEFDVESIHTVSIKDMGISDLGCIGECSCLERLDLSNNNITRLHKMAGLTNLTKLNLSANKLTSLDGLQLLDKLQSLNVSGNLLGSIDVLRVICNLGQLTNLTLHDQKLGLSNPMCNTSYIDEVLIMLPAVVMLDGQRVRGKGSELFKLCKEMDSVLNSLPAAPTGNLSVKKFTDEEVVVTKWIVDTEPKHDKVLDAEEQLSAMLASCKVLSQTAEEMLADAKDSHNFSLQSG